MFAMHNLQDKARRLVTKAQAQAGGDVPSPVEEFELRPDQVARCVLFSAFHDFETKLTRQTGAWEYDGGTLTFTEYKKWGDAESKRIRAPELNGHLRVIAASRHWLFHSTTYPIDASDVLRRMGRTLHLLSGLQHGQACPPGDGPPAGWSYWQVL